MATRLPDPMTWLAAGIPLTLLIDLLDESGPDSDQVYEEEPADSSWVLEEAA